MLIPEYEKNIMSEYTTEDKDLVFSNNNEVNMAAREIVNYGILNVLF